MLLDLGREAEQAHDLGHPGAGDALPAGDAGLVGGLAELEEGLRLRIPLSGIRDILASKCLENGRVLSRNEVVSGLVRSPQRRIFNKG